MQSSQGTSGGKTTEPGTPGRDTKGGGGGGNRTARGEAEGRLPEESEPILPELVSRVKSISESNIELRKELKSISRTFAGSQKVQESISGIEESLAAVLIQIQKQSGQITSLEKETKGLLAGLDEVSERSDTIDRLEGHLDRMQSQTMGGSQKESSRVNDAISREINEGVRTMRESSEYIARLSAAIDAARKEIRMVAEGSASASGTGAMIDSLRSEIARIADAARAGSPGAALKKELKDIASRVDALARSDADLQNVKGELGKILAWRTKVEHMGQILGRLDERVGQVASRTEAAESAGAESSRFVSGRLEQINAKIASLVQRADTTAFVGEGLKAVQEDIAAMKSDTADDIRDMGRRLSRAIEELRAQEAGAAETYRRTEELYAKIQDAKHAADRTARESERETLKLLRLSEYQSTIRMSAESGYGDLATIEEMARRTAGIAALFESKYATEERQRDSDGGGEEEEGLHSGVEKGLPLDIKRWAASTMLDCADRWEIRFSDVYSVMTEVMGTGMLGDALRLQQVRDIYGTRAAERAKSDLGIA